MDNYQCELKSKLFSGQYKNTWFKATVKIDENNRKICVNKDVPYLTSDPCDEYSIETIDDGDSKKVNASNKPIQPAEINLSSFKHIEKNSKTKYVNKTPCFSFEIATSKRLATKSIKFAIYTEYMFDSMYNELQKLIQLNISNPLLKRQSMFFIGNDISEHVSDSLLDLNDNIDNNNSNQQSSVRTVVNSNLSLARKSSIKCESKKMVCVKCNDTYQEILNEFLFSICIIQNKTSTNSVFSHLEIKNDFFYYLDSNKLQLLNSEKTLLYSWKYSNIIKYKYSSELFEIEMGPRCKSGAVVISCIFNTTFKASSVFVKLLDEKIQRKICGMCGFPSSPCEACRSNDDIYDIPTNNEISENKIEENELYMTNPSNLEILEEHSQNAVCFYSYPSNTNIRNKIKVNDDYYSTVDKQLSSSYDNLFEVKNKNKTAVTKSQSVFASCYLDNKIPYLPHGSVKPILGDRNSCHPVEKTQENSLNQLTLHVREIACEIDDIEETLENNNNTYNQNNSLNQTADSVNQLTLDEREIACLINDTEATHL